MARTGVDLGNFQAAILVGGQGTRLRGVTGSRLPKPMVDVAGRPFLEYLLRYLQRQGVRRICLMTGHQASVVEEYFGVGSALGLRIAYSRETSPLGTGGALRLALAKLGGDRFIVMNGDSYFGVELDQLVETHLGCAAPHLVATIALARAADGSRFGAVSVTPTGAITAFDEKSSIGRPGLVSAGIYVVERSLVESIPPGRPVSLERDVWPLHLGGGLVGLEMSGEFEDIGTPESLAALREAPGPLLRSAGI